MIRRGRRDTASPPIAYRTPDSGRADIETRIRIEQYTHVRAIAQNVMEELGKLGIPVHHEEGVTQGRWALLDYVDFVVHVFHPTLRHFYQLERLWSDAQVVPVQPPQDAPAGA